MIKTCIQIHNLLHLEAQHYILKHNIALQRKPLQSYLQRFNLKCVCKIDLKHDSNNLVFLLSLSDKFFCCYNSQSYSTWRHLDCYHWPITCCLSTFFHAWMTSSFLYTQEKLYKTIQEKIYPPSFLYKKKYTHRNINRKRNYSNKQ